MKKLMIIFMILFNSFLAVAANIGDDQVNIGQKGSTDDKALIFRDANKTSLSVEHLTSFMSWGGNQFSLGDGTNTSKFYSVDIGLGANNPSLVWDAPNNSFKQRVDGSLKGLGGGGSGGSGGINAFGEDDNADAESGTTGWTDSGSSFTTESITGVQAYGESIFSFTASATNEKVTSPSFDFSSQAYGRNCEAGFKYKTDSEDYELHVTDGNGDILNLVGDRKIYPTSSYQPFAVTFLCPSEAQITADTNKKDIKFEIVNMGTGATTKINWDFSYIGSNNNVKKAVLPNTDSVRFSHATPPVITSKSSDWFSSVDFVNTGRYEIIFKSGHFTVAPSCQVTPDQVGGSFQYANIVSASTTSVTIEIRRSDSSIPINSNASVSCQKQGADRDKTIDVFQAQPVTSDTMNTFTATIEPNGNVLTESSEWINGPCSQVSTGIKSCDVSALNNSLRMDCNVSITEGGNGTVSAKWDYNSSTNSTVVYSTQGAQNNTYLDRGVTLRCTRVDVDTIKPQTKNLSLSGFVKNKHSEVNGTSLSINSCYVASNSALDTINDYCSSWISSVSNSGGIYTINFSSAFKSTPNCWVSAASGLNFSQAGWLGTCNADSWNSSQAIVECGRVSASNSSTIVPSQFTISCIGEL